MKNLLRSSPMFDSAEVIRDSRRDRQRLELRARAVMRKMERFEIFRELARSRPNTARIEDWLLESLDDEQLENFINDWQEE